MSEPLPTSRSAGSTSISADAAVPGWQAALFGLLHPTKIAVLQAHLWIDQPLSVTLLFEVFEGAIALNNLAYHVRVLARAGVLHEVSTKQRRGALEHFYRLAT
jgi:hypothetical protein